MMRKKKQNQAFEKPVVQENTNREVQIEFSMYSIKIMLTALIAGFILLFAIAALWNYIFDGVSTYHRAGGTGNGGILGLSLVAPFLLVPRFKRNGVVTCSKEGLKIEQMEKDGVESELFAWSDIKSFDTFVHPIMLNDARILLLRTTIGRRWFVLCANTPKEAENEREMVEKYERRWNRPILTPEKIMLLESCMKHYVPQVKLDRNKIGKWAGITIIAVCALACLVVYIIYDVL